MSMYLLLAKLGSVPPTTSSDQTYMNGDDHANELFDGSIFRALALTKLRYGRVGLIPLESRPVNGVWVRVVRHRDVVR